MKAKLFVRSAIALVALTSCLSVSALAEVSSTSDSILDANTRSVGYIGALFGANVPSGDFGADNSPNFGLTLGAKPLPYLGIGLYASYFGQSNAGRIFGIETGSSTNTYTVVGEINAFYSIFHVGLDVGTEFVTWSANASDLSVSTSENTMVIGPTAGFDVPLSRSATHVSLGGEVHYLFTRASEAPDNLQALAALKVWL